jgi:hypothetical protein
MHTYHMIAQDIDLSRSLRYWQQLQVFRTLVDGHRFRSFATDGALACEFAKLESADGVGKLKDALLHSDSFLQFLLQVFFQPSMEPNRLIHSPVCAWMVGTQSN